MLRNRLFDGRGRRIGLMLVLVLTLVLAALPTAAMAYPAHSGNIHVVRAGESLSQIARYYGVTVSVMAHHNGISNPNRIYVGQHLRIPPAGAGHKPYPGHPPVGCAQYHHVRKGDTLSHIARWYGVQLHALAQLNNISNASKIIVGQKICIPSAWGSPGHVQHKPAPPVYKPPQHGCGPCSGGHGQHKPGHRHHVVHKGDTLSQIARWYGVSIHHLMHVNGIHNPSKIYVGQVIRF